MKLFSSQFDWMNNKFAYGFQYTSHISYVRNFPAAVRIVNDIFIFGTVYFVRH